MSSRKRPLCVVSWIQPVQNLLHATAKGSILIFSPCFVLSLIQAGGKPSPAYRAAEQQLQDFLCENVDVLDVGTTTGLLGAYGRLDQLLTYAQVSLSSG